MNLVRDTVEGRFTEISDEYINALDMPSKGVSAFAFSTTPIWVFEYQPTRCVWQFVKSTKLLRPVEFLWQNYKLDHQKNVFGFWHKQNIIYGVIVRHQHVTFMNVDALNSM